ncbi:MAG: hypothetical protein LC659_08910 [Myxococcales bacterium]|nr:hypothetical protein [Myxococcales bacterium]
MLPALALVAASTVARAAEPAGGAGPIVVAHVQLPELGEYAVTLGRNAEAQLFVRNGDDSVDIRIRVWDATRLHYEVKRSGQRLFQLQGELPPTIGRPFTLGQFPQAGDVKLWLTDK